MYTRRTLSLKLIFHIQTVAAYTVVYHPAAIVIADHFWYYSRYIIFFRRICALSTPTWYTGIPINMHTLYSMCVKHIHAQIHMCLRVCVYEQYFICTYALLLIYIRTNIWESDVIPGNFSSWSIASCCIIGLYWLKCPWVHAGTRPYCRGLGVYWVLTDYYWSYGIVPFGFGKNAGRSPDPRWVHIPALETDGSVHITHEEGCTSRATDVHIVIVEVVAPCL